MRNEGDRSRRGMIGRSTCRGMFRGALICAAVLVLAGCGEGASLGQAAQPREGRAGIQATGRIGGSQVAVSDGAPGFETGDCDPMDGADVDVCAIARDINGQVFVLSFENPGVLTPDTTLEIGDPGCDPRGCDEVTDVALVDVQSGVGSRMRARSGQLRLRQVQPYLRYAGSAELRLPDGRLSVEFDLVPAEG